MTGRYVERDADSHRALADSVAVRARPDSADNRGNRR